MTFEPSNYQQDIYDFAQNETGNSVVEAVAGSGKTTTGVEVMKRIPVTQRTIAVAFNKHIADTMKERFPAHVESSTMHSVGNRYIRQRNPRSKLNNYVVDNAIESLIAKRFNDKNEQDVATYAGKRLISMVKATLTDHNDVDAIIAMINRYDIELNSNYDLLLSIVPDVFTILDANPNEYDFDDMIYRPVRHGLITDRYDFTFVDEAQDLNRSQIEFAKVLASNGRLMAVGDRRQSIYGFRGADYDAIPSIIRETNATVLPLSITYRCPTSHVELAKTIVPAIEAAPNAKRGTINHTNLNHALESGYIIPSSLVLCRTNAPLASLAYRLIAANVPVIVRGRDIGEGIISLIKKLTKKRNVTTYALAQLVNEYANNERARLSKQKASDSRIQSLDDKLETVNVLCEGMKDSDSVVERVNRLFQDTNPSNAVVASSIHRAKGLEAENVSIIRPDLLPLRTKSPEAQTQEENIMYVAYTRSKSVLNFVAD